MSRQKKYCCNNCANGLPCVSSTFKTNGQNNFKHVSQVPAIPLSPNSGLFINACGQLDIDCEILGTKCAWPIGPTTPHQNYNWTVSPATIQEGSQVTLNVAGLAPTALFTVRITSSNGDISYWPLQADEDGNITNAKYRLCDGGLSYIFTPIYGTGTPNISSYSVDVLPCGTIIDCSCNGTVIIKPVLTANTVAAGQYVTLRLIVTNTNECPISNLTLPALSLPTGLTAFPSVEIQNETVNGKSTKTFEFNLLAQNATNDPLTLNITVPTSTGTYECGGDTFYAGGGSAALTILPSAGALCGLSIEEFSISPASGGEAVERTFTLTVKNIGTATITNLTMPAINFAISGFTVTSGDTSISIPPVASLAADATHTVTKSCYLESTGALPATYTLQIPAGYIYATCAGSLINNLANVSASTELTPP